MAGNKCAMYGCLNYAVKNRSKSYFRFPKDLDRCKQWVNLCRRADLNSIIKSRGAEHMNKMFRICSSHFSATMFKDPNLTSQGLKKNALPDHNLLKADFNKGVQHNPKKRVCEEQPSYEEPSVEVLPEEENKFLTVMEQLHGPIKMESVFLKETEEGPLQVDQKDTLMSEGKESEHVVEDPLTIIMKTEPLSGEQAQDQVKEEVFDGMGCSTEEECEETTEVEESKSGCAVCGSAGHGPVCEQCQLPTPEDPHISQEKLKEEMHKCTLCDRTYQTAKSLKRHTISAHSGENKYECKMCKKCFPLESNLKLHLLAHVDDKPFLCKICGLSFHLESLLLKHKVLHDQGGEYICNVCEISFLEQSLLNKHLRLHTKDSPFQCHICKKEFTRKSSLIKHLCIHSGERRFKCNLCEKAFIERTKLKIHIRTHTGDRQFKCEVSSKEFVDPNALRTHLNIHTGDKCYKCTVCEKVFSRRYTYKIHMLSHTGQRNFHCELCSMSFSERGRLSKHMLTHSNITFDCDICGETYRRKKSLNGHLLIHKNMASISSGGTMAGSYCERG